MPVKPLTFKGDKKPSKKRRNLDESDAFKPSKRRSSPSRNEDDDTWVLCDRSTDLSGPTLIVLPTSPPAALASDATGKVFASDIENLVDDDPGTSEPHDVRQVWVATPIPGNLGKITLKGSHGKYLSCGEDGLLSAIGEAVGPAESFEPVVAMARDDVEGEAVRGMFALKTFAEVEGEGSYITTAPRNEGKAKGTVIRGDGNGISHSTTVRLRMQARFKPRTETAKETRTKEKISKSELERAVGRSLNDDEVKRLKRARREGTYHEELLDFRAKGKSDKFAS